MQNKNMKTEMTNDEMIEHLKGEGFAVFEDEEVKTLLADVSDDDVYEYLCDQGYEFDEKELSDDDIANELYSDLNTGEHVRLIEVLREKKFINPIQLINIIESL